MFQVATMISSFIFNWNLLYNFQLFSLCFPYIAAILEIFFPPASVQALSRILANRLMFHRRVSLQDIFSIFFNDRNKLIVQIYTFPEVFTNLRRKTIFFY